MFILSLSSIAVISCFGSMAEIKICIKEILSHCVYHLFAYQEETALRKILTASDFIINMFDSKSSFPYESN